MRTSQHIHVTILIVVAFVLMLCAGSIAQQDARFSVDFQGTNISTAMEILKRYDRSFSYTLPSQFENKTVTASLVDVTLDEALSIMLDQVNLTFVKDNNVYKIREKKERTGGRAERPMPSYGSPVYTTRPTSPQTGGQAAAAPSTDADDEESEEEMRRNLPPRMIRIQYGAPALIAELFGGGAIYGGDTGGGSGGYGGSSRGGYGGSSRSGGIGGSRSSGIGSSRSSGIGSSRSSGIGSSSNYR